MEVMALTTQESGPAISRMVGETGPIPFSTMGAIRKALDGSMASKYGSALEDGMFD